jgi:hypothetical protein
VLTGTLVVCENPPMKRTLAAVVVGALLLVSCGSDESSSATVVPSEPTSTEAAATTTDAAVVDTTVAEAAALVPEAVCRGVDGEVYFGYTNESSEPVVVEEGDANQLSGGAPDDNPLLTTLFAPGTVEVAFWAVPPEGSGDDVVWTLTGPDGVERTATTTEACPQDFPAVADPEPVLEVVGQTLAADGASVDVDLRLVGLDETSVCSEGLTAEPRLVVINEGEALPTSFEPEATVTVGPFTESAAGGLLANTRVYAFVLEQCSAGDVTASSWSPELRRLNLGTEVCARLDDAGELSVELTEGLCDLGVTGGSGIRPR